MYKVGKCLLLDLLNKRRMTQNDLAIELGVSRQRVNALVHNRAVMSFETALNISKILHCDMEELYELVEVSGE